MDNLKQPAYPAKVLGDSVTKEGETVIWDCPGFTITQDAYGGNVIRQLMDEYK